MCGGVSLPSSTAVRIEEVAMLVGHAQQGVRINRSSGIQDVVLRDDLVFQPSYLLLVVRFPLLIALEAPLVVRA